MKDSWVQGDIKEIELKSLAFNTNEKLNKFSNGLCTDVSDILNVRNRGLKLRTEVLKMPI